MEIFKWVTNGQRIGLRMTDFQLFVFLSSPHGIFSECPVSEVLEDFPGQGSCPEPMDRLLRSKNTQNIVHICDSLSGMGPTASPDAQRGPRLGNGRISDVHRK